jgi:hypothetical protein
MPGFKEVLDKFPEELRDAVIFSYEFKKLDKIKNMCKNKLDRIKKLYV